MPFPLFQLPLELREEIYSYYFRPAIHKIQRFGAGQRYAFDLQLYRANKQVYYEAQTVFRRDFVFVRVETPWPAAVEHIAVEGGVRIVADEVRNLSNNFRHHHMTIKLEPAMLIRGLSDASHPLIILIDDIEAFSKLWYYDALNQTLNPHLRVVFSLQDPYYPADPKPVPIALQKRLLLPFTKQKDIFELEVNGFDGGVKAELEKGMAVPLDSVEKCFEKSTAFLVEGDQAIAEGRIEEALDLYKKSFLAIHIIVEDRHRHVYGESFFDTVVTDGQYKHQDGSTVRILLRLKLVARMVNVYLKFHQYEEAAFWGMRTINIMRENMLETTFEDFHLQFPGIADAELIYLRTAIAFKKLEEAKAEELEVYKRDELASSWGLFSITAKFLRNGDQKVVQKELREHDCEWNGPIILEEVGRQESDADSMAPMHQNSEDSDM